MRESKPDFEAGLKEIYFSESKQYHKFAIIIARWNQKYNKEMLYGAKEAFTEYGIKEENIEVFYVPGALEMPIFAQALADSDIYSAILCFGTIVRGDTYHFDIVANESARGLMQVSLDYDVPVLNGILAVNNEEQAQKRAMRDQDNKGYEVAISALDLVHNLERINA